MICSRLRCTGPRVSNSFFDLGNPTTIAKRGKDLLGPVRDDCHIALQLDGNRRDVFHIGLSTDDLAERKRLLLSDQDERNSPG